MTLAAVVALGGGLAWWLLSTEEQVATAQVAGEASGGVLRIDGLAEDPGARALAARVVAEAEPGTPLAWLAEATGEERAARILLPRELTLALERDAVGAPAFVGAANLASGTRALRLALERAVRRDELAVRGYRGLQVFARPEGGGMALHGGTLLFSDSEAVLRRAVDRLLDPAPATALAAGSDLAAAVPEGEWDVAGALVDDEGVLSEVLATPDDATPARTAAPATGSPTLGFGFDVADADAAVGRLQLQTTDPAAAESWRRQLDRRLARTAGNLAADGVELRWQSRVEEGRVVTEVDLSGLAAALGRWLGD